MGVTITILKNMLFDYSGKLLLMGLAIILLVTLFKSFDRIIERKKAKKYRDFKRKMQDYDRRTERW